MINQREEVLKKDWDLLIILDACRYDFFREIYDKYLPGQLRPAISPASQTNEWVVKVLKQGDFGDVTLVSGHPQLNSLRSVRGPVGKVNAKSIFKRVVDVWLEDWDADMNSVPPKRMTKKVIEETKKTSNSKAIAWYPQPHEPYLGFDIRKRAKCDKGKEIPRFFGKPLVWGIKFFGVFLEERVSTPKAIEHYWKRIRNLPISIPIEFIREAYIQLGEKGLRKAYVENLKLVLFSLQRLSKELPDKKVVITTDHGERLGRKGLGHPPYSSDPVLRLVPWMVMH